ncbi:MAG TPA: glycosyltransferase family 2 protein [Chitinophagaceae bacterium]|nr:glycosyltransferase family 2 protein [Chitinophagaceae bacterium]
MQPNTADGNALSVIIITYNEENSIGRCIKSVLPIADEIIVLDSYSTDATVEIARSMGAVVRQEKFKGYIEQKNRALQLSSNNFVLSLDADEALDQELVDSILAAKKKFSAKAYKMNRCANYCGQFIRHGLWYPDRKTRLFDKRLARWGGSNPHDRVVHNKQVAVKHLKGNILHYSYNSIEEHILQNNHFSTISARTLHEKGVRSHWGRILFSPLWTFLHGYLLRAGFLDGFYGFVIAINASHYTFLKYIKLYHQQIEQRAQRVKGKKNAVSARKKQGVTV